MLRHSIHHRRHSHQAAAGMTLLDLVVTLLITGILLGSASLKYASSNRRFQVVVAAQRLRADLDYARKNARQTSSDNSLVFNVAENEYTFSGLTNPWQSETDTVNLGSGLGAELVSVNFGGSSTIVFNMFGRPVSNESWLNGRGQIVVRSGEFQKTVEVVASNGLIHVID